MTVNQTLHRTRVDAASDRARASRPQAEPAARREIALAERTLMARYRVSLVVARRILRDITRRTGRPLRQVAGEIVLSAESGCTQTRSGPASGDGGGPSDATPVVDGWRVGLQGGRRLRPEVSPRQPDGTLYIRADGNWTQSTARALRVMFARAFRQQPTLVIAELSGVMEMDSVGLGTLVAAHRDLAAAGCHLELHNSPPDVRRLLVLAGLQRALGPVQEPPG